MKVTKTGGGASIRLIVTAMITNRAVLSVLSDKWESPGPFPDKWSNIIGGWCVKHFLKYGKPPGRAIETIYERWAAKRSNAEVDIIGTFLQRLSDHYASRKKDVNEDYVIDEAKHVFETAAARQLIDEATADLEAGEPEKALGRIDKFIAPQIGTGAVISLLDDLKGMEEDLTDPEADILIEYPGAVGKFFGDTFSRGNFVSFAAPEKGSKSFWLLDVVVRGAEQGNKVFYFQAGDMNRKQIRRRFAARYAGRPFKPGILRIPTQLDTVGEVLCQFGERKKYSKYMTPDRAQRAILKAVKQGTKKDRIKLVVMPARSLSVSGIRSMIDAEIRRQWVPDIIVIDYADILANSAGFQGESRDAINDIWTGLRSISHGPLVVTATQVKRTSYNSDYITKGDTADDKRKLAHVTAMIGIVSKTEEKKQGVCRLNNVVLREGAFAEEDSIFCAGALAVANPCILSSY